MPSREQASLLLKTIEDVNTCCNAISDVIWRKRIFNKFKVHHEVYYPFKAIYNLTSQIVIRCISKTSDAYKADKNVKRVFKNRGSITYDSRVLSYTPGNIVSIWAIGGRLKIPFKTHNPHYLGQIKGEADLVYEKGKFYLHQTIDVPNSDAIETTDFIGCDFGQTDICTLSDGTNYNSEILKKVRKKYSKVRASVQAKGTKSSKRLLKRLSGRERRFVSINNHTISKQIVAKAKSEKMGIAIEDLSNIRSTAKVNSKTQKTELNRWSFYQLRQYLTYKATLTGIKIFAVPAAFTSQTCSDCMFIGERKGKTFICKNCGTISDADHNAAKNIAAWGCVINQPEKSSILYCNMHYPQV